MLSSNQFEQLQKFAVTFLSEAPEMMQIIKKSGLTAEQLKVIGILTAYTIRAYDDIQRGAEITFRK